MECGFQNNIIWAIDPNERYPDPREKMVNEREADLQADAIRNVRKVGIFK